MAELVKVSEDERLPHCRADAGHGRDIKRTSRSRLAESLATG